MIDWNKSDLKKLIIHSYGANLSPLWQFDGFKNPLFKIDAFLEIQKPISTRPLKIILHTTQKSKQASIKLSQQDPNKYVQKRSLVQI